MSRKRIVSLLSAVMLIVSLTACNSAAIKAMQQLQSEASSSASSQSSASSAQTSSLPIPMPTLPASSAASSQSSAAESSVPQSSSEPVNTDIVEEQIELFDVMIGGNRDQKWEEDRCLYESSWEFVQLDDVASMDYPDLAYSLYDLNMAVNNSGYEIAYEFSQMIEANPEASFYTNYVYEENVRVCRADSRMVSLLYSIYYNTGGARPHIAEWSVNLDNSGSSVSLDTLLNEPENFTELLEQRLYDENPDVVFIDDLSQYLHNVYENDDLYWTLDYQCLRVFFQSSEIAAAAAGAPQAVFWFDEYPDLLRAEYTQAPENYTVEIPLGTQVHHDLKPGDGTKDMMYIAAYPGHELDYNELELWLNDNSYPLVINEIDRAYAFLQHVEYNGEPRVFLYLIAYGMNDYPHLLILDLNGEEPVQVAELYGVGLPTYSDDEFGSMIELISNPVAFALETRLDLLGTMFGTRSYSVEAESGLPVSPTRFFYIQAEPELTVLQPLDVTDIIAGKVITLPVGTKIKIVNSDGESEVEAMTENYDFYRFFVDKSDWPATINGIPEDEVFDGIMYAG